MLKKENGFTTVDIAIALIIIVGFISIITSGFYNYYISSASVSRNSAALSYTIDVIEAAEEMNYDSVTQNDMDLKIQELYNNKSISSSYNVTATVENYNETEGNTGKLDLIKILTVTVDYDVGKKNEQVQISRLIIKK